MERFEYKVLTTRCELLRGPVWYDGQRPLGQDISSILNGLGASGWELVSLVDARRRLHTLYLKRRC
jgi:hypothetical protein